MADDGPIIVDLGVSNAQAGAADDTIEALKDLAQAHRDTAQAMRDAAAARAQLRSQSGQGPAGRLQTAQQALANARANNDPAQIFDAQYKAKLAQDALDRAQNRMNGNQSSPLMTAIMTSRMNFGGQGGGVSPLVGRSLHALSGATGMATGALMGLTAVVVGAVAAFGAAVQMGRQVRGAYWGGGASRSTGGIMGVGALAGMDGARAGQFARSLGDRLLNDPVAAMFARQAGIDPRASSPWGGSQDNALQMMKAAEHIRKSTERQAVIFARATGTEDLLGLRDVSESTFREAKQMFREIASPQFRRASAEFDAQMAQLGAQWEKFKTIFGMPILAGLTGLLDGVNTLFERTFSGARANMGGGGWGRNPGDFQKQLDSATRQNTDALDRNTDAVMGLSRAIFGGGARARRAIPAGWSHHSVRDAAQGAAINLGAFGL